MVLITNTLVTKIIMEGFVTLSWQGRAASVTLTTVRLLLIKLTKLRNTEKKDYTYFFALSKMFWPWWWLAWCPVLLLACDHLHCSSWGLWMMMMISAKMKIIIITLLAITCAASTSSPCSRFHGSICSLLENQTWQSWWLRLLWWKERTHILQCLKNSLEYCEL